MKSIFDLNNTDRRFWSATVRDCLDLSEVSSATWAKYRKLAGVPIQEKNLTKREFFLLWVLTRLPRKRGINRVSLAKAANALLNAEGFSLSADLPASELSAEGLREIMGKELGLPGPVSERTLYRWGKSEGIPLYSRKARYSGYQIKRLIAHGKKIAA